MIVIKTEMDVMPTCCENCDYKGHDSLGDSYCYGLLEDLPDIELYKPLCCPLIEIKER